MCEMGLGGFCGVMDRVLVVTAGQVRMMCRRLVRSCFVVLSGFLVVPGRVFVVLCGFVMMFSCFVCHKSPFGSPWGDQAESPTTVGVSSSAINVG
jgi:hypothetical protein